MDLRFHVDCEPGSLILPAYVANGPRADGLWQTTCFELFVRHPDQRGYFEFNFSPSTQWAAYRFSGYREGMAEWPMQRPDIHCTSSDMGAILEAAGASFRDVVKCSVFVKDMHQFARINTVYTQYFDLDTAPARELVEVANLPRFVNIEISCIAALQAEALNAASWPPRMSPRL